MSAPFQLDAFETDAFQQAGVTPPTPPLPVGVWGGGSFRFLMPFVPTDEDDTDEALELLGLL